MIELTDRAASHIRRIRKLNGYEGQPLRVSVTAGGCSGFMYDLNFESEVKDIDQVLDHGDVRLIVDPMSLQYLDGTTIDYVEKSKYDAGFSFNNPNVTSECGCGKSFTAN